MEDLKSTIDAERTHLQTQARDMERDALQLQQQLHFTQEELQKCHENNTQFQNEEKQLQAKLANEIEEKERIQLQLHQVKKQVWKCVQNLFDSCMYNQFCISGR